MDVEYPGFGQIVVEGTRYDHDVIVEKGAVRARKKGPSKPHRSTYGHTPLSAAEDIPWSTPRLLIGTGFSGRLPIMPEVHAAAEERGVEVIAVPTSEACALLRAETGPASNAILHVTC